MTQMKRIRVEEEKDALRNFHGREMLELVVGAGQLMVTGAMGLR